MSGYCSYMYTCCIYICISVASVGRVDYNTRAMFDAYMALDGGYSVIGTNRSV